ncbi:MAG: helix-turn-helix transcriptional regulator [Bacteroidota bacterium]|nr:helix-turn-helix transcriptional regulator [Bacteroidota bacterium]MDP4232718.1 helix-turn-helix transcriptional regulator [Bacteroidota bacterium]MDP4243149.1 helix-turn-helix transcriptional regulator [Bacteroidota bacterium]MDP4287606.1 helix-turn-helix transcriptional regulator [Bacteroidota bacterium]
MTISAIIAENVRGFRTQRGWSQARLAEEARLHPNYIGYVERAERHITVHKLVDVARVLKVKPSLFLIEGAYRKSAKELNTVLHCD